MGHDGDSRIAAKQRQQLVCDPQKMTKGTQSRAYERLRDHSLIELQIDKPAVAEKAVPNCRATIQGQEPAR